MTRILPLLIVALIFVTVILPAKVSGATSASSTIMHTVVRGDTLYSLSRRYGTTVEAIMQENHLHGTTIYIGQYLSISISSPPSSGNSVYIVVRHDTLYSIARRYGTTVDAIMVANNLSSTLILVGQQLIIPSSKTPLPPTAIMPTSTPTPTGTLVATAVPSGTPCPCDADTLNCENFTTQPQAQACQDYCEGIGRGDIHNLDGNANGIACEELPGRFTVLQ